MKILSSLSLWALAGAVSCSMALAQSAAPAARILSHVDESNLVALKGNVNPHANTRNDRGPVSGDLQMAGMTLVLSRSADQQAAFDAFVASQYDKSSPNFHQWLTPQQIGAQYGPAQADIDTISAWLSSHGFTVKGVAPDHMTIQFSGTAAQVESAFHTEIHNLNVDGAAHIANMTDPQIPAAIASVVVGIKGLHNFFPHPLHRMGNKVQFNADAHGWVKVENSPAASLAAGGVRAQLAPSSARLEQSLNPNFYFPITDNGQTIAVEEDVAPADFAKIYNLPSGWPTSNNGSGQTIAIIGTSDICLGQSGSPCNGNNDIQNFKSAFGLPAGLNPKVAHGPDGDPGNCANNSAGDVCNSGDLSENSLDVEWSGAVAPGAQVVLVTDAFNSQTTPTNDPLFDGAQWAIANAYTTGSAVDGARIISLSYGGCELFNGTASNVAYNNLWQTAASAGIAVFVATGDAGAPACDQGGDIQYGIPYEAQYGLGVNGLGSGAYNTAVGGTDFSWCKPSYTSSGNFQGCSASNAAPYWSASNTAQQASAQNYVPEIPWNDSCLNPIWTAYFQSIAPLFKISAPGNPEAACNFIYNDWVTIDQDSEASGDGQFVLAWGIDTAGGGGGASNCVVNSTSSVLGTCVAGANSTGSAYGNLTLVNDGWPKPSWQSGVSPSDGVRDIPDVSFFSGDGLLDSATLVCDTYDGAACTSIGATASGAAGGAEEVGGTSVATPEMAGVMALINQKAGAPQGLPNAELYTLAGKQNSSNCKAENGTTSNGCYFNDVDSGTNAMPCDYEGNAMEGGAVEGSNGQFQSSQAVPGLTSPNCAISNTGDVVGTLSGYSAGTGYDLATGLGSLNIANVVNNWTAIAPVTGSNTATLSVTPAAGSLSSNATLGVTVVISGAAGTPTGTITLSAGSYISTQQVGTSGCTTCTFTVSAYAFDASGTSTITAGYSGDGTYAPATASANVSVTYLAPPTFKFATPSNPSAVSPGGSATASISGQLSSGYSGTVTVNSCILTGSTATSLNAPPTCTVSGTITFTGGTPSGTATATVSTTAATAELVYPKLGNGKGHVSGGISGWTGAGGAVLAFLVFLGIPARRRSWRNMLGVLILMVALGSLSACGGGSSGSGSTTTTTTTASGGTTAGSYTFTVYGTGNDQFNTLGSTTFTVTVN